MTMTTELSPHEHRPRESTARAVAVTGVVLLVAALVIPLRATPAGAHTRPAIGIAPATQSIAVGADANWVISVSNTGPATLSNVRVIDPRVPACAKTFSGTLAPGAREPSYRCAKADVQSKFVNRVRVRADSSGKSQRPLVRFWGGPSSAAVEIVGFDVGISCVTPIRVGSALACQYVVSVPDGDDPVNFYEDQAKAKVLSAGGTVSAGPNLLAGAPQDATDGAFCGSSSELCILQPGSSIVFGPVSYYTVQAGDYQLSQHLLTSLFYVPWSATCDAGEAQCPGADEVSADSAVKPAGQGP
jgi:hypothetical protein